MKLPACAVSTLLVLVAIRDRGADAFAFVPSIVSPASTSSSYSSSYSSSSSPLRLSAVSRKDSYDITLLPGDGIGPEIMSATKSVLSALSARCDFELRTTDV